MEQARLYKEIDPDSGTQELSIFSIIETMPLSRAPRGDEQLQAVTVIFTATTINLFGVTIGLYESRLPE